MTTYWALQILRPKEKFLDELKWMHYTGGHSLATRPIGWSDEYLGFDTISNEVLKRAQLEWMLAAPGFNHLLPRAK